MHNVHYYSCIFYGIIFYEREGDRMPLKYKINVLEALKDAGYTTYKLKKEKLLAESTMQKLRKDIMVSSDNLERLCELLKCQPSKLIEYVKE